MNRAPKSVRVVCRRAFQGDESSSVVEAKRPRACVGTTVTVHNLFHTMPVRRKQVDEALEFEKVTCAGTPRQTGVKRNVFDCHDLLMNAGERINLEMSILNTDDC